MSVQKPVPVGKVVAHHGRSRMHWLVPHVSGEGLQAACAGQNGSTPSPAVRHYDGYLAAITCYACQGKRAAALRQDAIEHIVRLAGDAESESALEALYLLGVRDREIRHVLA